MVLKALGSRLKYHQDALRHTGGTTIGLEETRTVVCSQEKISLKNSVLYLRRIGNQSRSADPPTLKPASAFLAVSVRRYPGTRLPDRIRLP